MFNNRERTTSHALLPARPAMTRALARRSPILFLAVALMALAVFFAPGAQPAQADHGDSAPVLAEVFVTGTVTRDDKTYTFPLVVNPVFDPHTQVYTIRVPSDLTGITFTPYWTDNTVHEVLLVERASSSNSIDSSGVITDTATSGTALTNRSSPSHPALHVANEDEGKNDGFHYFNLQKISDGSPTFDTTTVEDRTYTAGHEISHLGLNEAEKDALRLPKASVEYYSGEITYTATGLPTGLTMGHDRLIRGTPAAATTSPAEVDYTATDEIGGSVTRHFHITVAPPVEWSEPTEVATFKNTIIEYTVGQSEPISMTLPAADGGHGTLTYGLSYWVKETRVVDGRTITGGVEKSINDDAPGFSFDASTRVLSSDTGMDAPSVKAFYSVDYWAEDENGARAIASNSITVNEAPTILGADVESRTWTVGESVSVTLPEAEGGTRVGVGIRYELGGVDLSALGISFNGRTRTISGTPHLGGEMQLAYTATDRNGVSDSIQIDVTINNGPSAPASAPSSVQAAQTYPGADPNGSGAVAVWDTVSGATGYVVQVRADAGSYPDLAVNSAPADVNLNLPNVDSGLVWIDAISTGDYKVRVAARNGDGVGPWSEEVSFTVSGPTPQSPPPGDPCTGCGTGGDTGVVTRGQAQYADLIAQMKEWRNDPEWAHLKEHTDRWDRALLAFGETVEDTTLTPMTAAEAQGFADRGWERWVEVAKALRELENQAPTVSSAIADVTIVHDSGSHEVSLSGVFDDPDGDALTISAASSDETIATVSVSADFSSLTVTGASEGTATITVTAEDPDGERASDDFQVEVVGRYAALIARMYQWREDPQWRHQKSHTDRWDRALLAFGETVADATLTAMTAAEAQGYADTNWGERWVPVAAALWELQNRAPTVAAAISDVTIVNETGTQQVSLSGVFSDGDNDALTVTAASSNTAVATVSAASDGSSLTVTAQARGTATVTVTANDGNGGTVEDSFTVTVKAAPGVASAITDVSGLEAGSTQDVSLSGVFSDADGDALTVTAASSDEAKATVAVASDGSKLTLSGVAEGTATITVTAQDSDGNRVMDDFDVSVVARQQQQQLTANQAPTVASAIADATIVNEGGSKQVSLSGVFSDADSDGLTVSAASSDEAKATVTVATDYSSLTVAAQARGTATITVTADDGNGGTVSETFTVTVKAAPVVASAIADLDLKAGATEAEGGVQDVALSEVFSDADGDALTFSADTSDFEVAEAFLFQGTLTVLAVAGGSATVTVTAQDSDGNTVSDSFDVSVAAPPTPVSNLGCVAQTGRVLFSWDAPEWSGAAAYAYDYDLTRPGGGREQSRLFGYPAVSARGEYQAGQEASISVKAVYELADGSQVSSAAATLTCTVAE